MNHERQIENLALQNLPSADQESRVDNLSLQLAQLPDEAFTKLQYLQAQTGCFNRCTFCSQGAGTEIWQLTSLSMSDLTQAIRRVSSQRDLELTQERPHKPDTIFPYFDNDIMSYPYLDEYVEMVDGGLNRSVRISTVGYSRKNEGLQEMHTRIAQQHTEAISGIRFSFTPYTFGLRGIDSNTDRAEYERDLANTIQTYKPVMDHLGTGRDTFCVELRFKPNIDLPEKAVSIESFGEGTLIDGGNYTLFVPDVEEFVTNQIVGVQDGKPVLEMEGYDGILIVGRDKRDRINSIADIDPEDLQSDSDYIELDGSDVAARKVRVHKFENIDGEYYVADPFLLDNGEFRAIHFYPNTENRTSGVMNSERYLLNAILAYKHKMSVPKEQGLDHASSEDVEAVLDLIRKRASWYEGFDTNTARHIREEVLSLVRSYTRVIDHAQLPHSYFFDKNFTVDTGQIVNQGRAKSEFKGLVTRDDAPLTPNEEKGYGNISLSKERGNVWRWTPNPQLRGSERPRQNKIGRKNIATTLGSINVMELDTRNLMPITPEGDMLRRYTITGVELERVNLTEGTENKLYPGIN